MDRRGFLLTTAGALLAPAASRAKGSDGVAPYLARLQRGLDDAGGGRFVDGTESRLLFEHNSFRQSQGLNDLQRSAALDAAARAHVADLLRRNYFQHASPEGYTSEQRVALLARRFVGAAGENIAMQEGGASAPTASALAKMWRESPGHRTNMLRPDYSHVGFGVVALGDRTIAGAVFGQRFAELAAAAPLHVGGGAALAGVLDGAAPHLISYDLQPVDGGDRIGPFGSKDAPGGLTPGAYAIRPHAPDPEAPHRYWILFGPIVLAG